MNIKSQNELFSAIIPAIDKEFSNMFVNCSLDDISAKYIEKKANTMQSQISNYIGLKSKMYCELAEKARLDKCSAKSGN